MNLLKKSSIERDKSAFKKIINKLAAAQKSKKLPSDYLSIIKSIYRGRLVCRNVNI